MTGVTAFAQSTAYAAVGPGESYPSRPIRAIVPLFTGAGTDIIARRFSSQLSQSLGQQIVVDNRPGASTTLGTNIVAKSAPDGYTLLIATTSTMSVLPSVMKPPYDPKELLPVAAFCVSPFVYVVSSQAKIQTLKDLVSTGRAAPGKLTYGSSGTGTLTHMVVELFSVVTKANFQHVPYKGVTGAHVDILGGRIDFVADSPASTLPHITAKRFRALAITTPKRSALLPDVPTFAELGLAAAESDFVTGLIAPAGLPKPLVARLQNETLKVARSAEFREFLAQQAYEPLSLDSDQFSVRIRTELAKWQKVVRERNIKIDQ
ncbi:MAG TPA: tripartite tricarboxylate transporter substrate binding protein [Burkholderiales bacterium]|nr:tripartite tricarboxylate transporter substrate binding protein [Burkholderiales bacterium]